MIGLSVLLLPITIVLFDSMILFSVLFNCKFQLFSSYSIAAAAAAAAAAVLDGSVDCCRDSSLSMLLGSSSVTRGDVEDDDEDGEDADPLPRGFGGFFSSSLLETESTSCLFSNPIN